MSTVLWHIPVSHYSEKARWALEYKGVEHARRAPPPASHIPIALWLTRGAVATFPVLALDDWTVGDSTAVIAALEERYPEPPLYPSDPAERERALELEDHFDEELGPYSRRLGFYELRRDERAMREFSAEMLPGSLARSDLALAITARGAAAFASLRYGAGSTAGAERAREKVIAALGRVESELDRGAGEYLVGDHFTVADLTAAALLAPIVDPQLGPALPSAPPAFAEFRDSLRSRPGFEWVETMFERHRGDPVRP